MWSQKMKIIVTEGKKFQKFNEFIFTRLIGKTSRFGQKNPNFDSTLLCPVAQVSNFLTADLWAGKKMFLLKNVVDGLGGISFLKLFPKARP